jgi:hypothetical protein
MTQDDMPELARAAGYLIGIAAFLALRRRGFLAAASIAFGVALAVLLLAYAVLALGPPAVFALAMLYLGILAVAQMLPLLLILGLLHGALVWWARRTAQR